MPLSYKPLWKTLIDKDMKRCDLLKYAGISSNVLAKLGKNEYISLQSLERICLALDCDVSSVITFVGREEDA